MLQWRFGEGQEFAIAVAGSFDHAYFLIEITGAEVRITPVMVDAHRAAIIELVETAVKHIAIIPVLVIAGAFAASVSAKIEGINTTCNICMATPHLVITVEAASEVGPDD